jgi:hypothetical protein
MPPGDPPQSSAPGAIEPLIRELERDLDNLEAAKPFAKALHQSRVLGVAQKLLESREGLEALDRAAPRFGGAGLFAGGDWDHPDLLQPLLVRDTLLARGSNQALECLSELRFLALAEGRSEHPEVSPAEARRFLEEVLALNLDLLYPEATEASRQRAGPKAERVRRLLELLTERLGTDGTLNALVDEAERILEHRPIMIHRVEAMIHTAARSLKPDEPTDGSEPGADTDPRSTVSRARRLIEALEGPTELSRACREPESYRELLSELPPDELLAEARRFGRTMRKTGLVAPQHAPLLRFLAETAPRHLSTGLGLTRVGRTSLAEGQELVVELVRRAVCPETARCIYGMYRMLEDGTLFFRPVVPGLRRLMVLPLHERVAAHLVEASGLESPPSAHALLLAGTISVLGQPRGVDQGHNPTCQAARAISLWAQNDVGLLLDIIACAARDDDITLHFEGEPIRSSDLSFGLAGELHPELDPVSLVLTPHLDRIYMEMSRRTIDRPGDGHRWVNPELHGWWVYRGFASAVHEPTGAVHDYERFARLFYATYHPEYNGGRDLVYAQPCGIAVTSSHGLFVGWHAVSIQRVALDPDGAWRVYFFNPNRDKGQDWGLGAVTSTGGHGELEGESSLPFHLFASRLYVFHYHPRELGEPDRVPAELVAPVEEAARASWAAGRAWYDQPLEVEE